MDTEALKAKIATLQTEADELAEHLRVVERDQQRKRDRQRAVARSLLAHREMLEELQPQKEVTDVVDAGAQDSPR